MPVNVRNESEETNGPLNEHMNSEMNRFATFECFPNIDKPYSTRLAQAGFYYTLTSDEVRCRWCEKVFYDWSAVDDPFEVHRNYSPTCPFLTNNKLMNIVVTSFPDEHLSLDMSESLDLVASFDNQSNRQREDGQLVGAVGFSNTFEEKNDRNTHGSHNNRTKASTKMTTQSLPSTVKSVKDSVQNCFAERYTPIQTIFPSRLQPTTNEALEVNVIKKASKDVVNATPLLPPRKSTNKTKVKIKNSIFWVNLQISFFLFFTKLFIALYTFVSGHSFIFFI